MSQPRCRSFTGAHKYSARFDLSAPKLTSFSLERGDPTTALNAMKAKTYVRDVCERCGDVIERQSSHTPKA